MRSTIDFFINNYKLTIILSAFLFIYGVMGLNKMNSELFPSVSMATATVITFYDGASAEDIESKITKPIEDEIKGVIGIKDISSVSKSGLSHIVVRVDMDNYDVATVMDEIQKKVEGTPGLPNDLQKKPEFLEINSEEMPVYQIALVGPNNKRQRDYTADELEESLEEIAEVKSANPGGNADRMFQIRLDLKKMDKSHIGVTEVLQKIQARNVNIPAGTLKSHNDEALLRVEGKIKTLQDIEGIMIRSNFSGKKIYLKDIALVEDSQEDKRIFNRFNGESATLVTVVKKAKKDTLKLVAELEKKLIEFKKEQKYPEIKLFVFKDVGIEVQNKVDVLASNAFTGLLLVAIFLFIFMPWRTAIAASLSLPIVCMATFGIMPVFGMNLDAMTILALIIAIGMLVDNSVVISESYSRYLSEGVEAKEAAGRAVEELWGAITASACTTIAAFIPMLITKGIMGAFIMVIPIIVTAALLLSLAESFFMLPMRLVNFEKKSVASSDDSDTGIYGFFRKKFEFILGFLVKYRYLNLLFFSVIVATSMFFLVKMNKFILFPAEETDTYVARFEARPGTRIEKTDELAKRFSLQIKEKLGNRVDYIISTVGEQRNSASDSKGGDGAHLGLINIYVTDDTKYNVPYTEVLKMLSEINVSYLEKVSYEEVINGPAVGNPIEAKFMSNNADNLNQMLEVVMSEMKKIDGVIDLKINDLVGEDEIFIDIDYAQADRVGLTVEQIGNTLRAAVSGRVISDVTLNNKTVDLKLRLKEDYRQNLKDLGEIEIQNTAGDLISLNSIATFRRKSGSPQIRRYKNKRSRAIVGSVDSTIITSDAANAKLKKIYEKAREKIKGVSLYQGGAAESTSESMESLVSAAGLAGLGIIALLVFMFNSFLKPIIIMTTIPLGLFGFSISFYFHNKPVSFLALIGVIGLAGMIVNSGIVLISYIDQLKKEGKYSIDEILVKASSTRLKAVMVTSLTTISGLFPTAYGIGGHDSMLIPMTLAMAWGLTTGTIFTLIWIPSAYKILEDWVGLMNRLLKRDK